ncbi:hypothetical protein SH661x_001939 [Planctomicrobium sp. SH661]|uniref:hypothetical protein n=1 Tax=Planctomicrobium sp. SH661 TaxID=3448124 RepID=UPI003F5C6089
MPPITHTLTHSGLVGTLNFSCDPCLDVDYICHHVYPMGCNRYWRDTTYTNTTDICLPPYVDLWPSDVYEASNDGFALAEEEFDDTEDYLQFDNDNMERWFWCMTLEPSATSTALAHGTTFRKATLEFRAITAGMSAEIYVSAVETLPTTAPVASESSFTAVSNSAGWWQIDVTSLIRAELLSVAPESTLSSVSLLVEIKPTGTSGDALQVASSRHSTLPGPRIVVRR